MGGCPAMARLQPSRCCWRARPGRGHGPPAQEQTPGQAGCVRGKRCPRSLAGHGIEDAMGSRGTGEFRGTDRFAVRRRVGSGGMGVVYEAYDLERDMRVAIKTILDVDASTIYRFKKEFRSLTDVAHPNLVKIHELVLSDDHCFYTMEFVNGVDFLQFVCPTDPLSPDDPLSDTLDTYVALESTGLTGKTTPSGVTTEPEVPLVGEGAPPVPDTVPASGTSGTTSAAPGGGSSGDSRTSTENAMQAGPAGEPAAERSGRPGRRVRGSHRAAGPAVPRGAAPRRAAAALRGAPRPAHLWPAAPRHQAVQRAGRAAGRGWSCSISACQPSWRAGRTTIRRPTATSWARRRTWPPSRRPANRSHRRATGTAWA